MQMTINAISSEKTGQEKDKSVLLVNLQSSYLWCACEHVCWCVTFCKSFLVHCNLRVALFQCYIMTFQMKTNTDRSSCGCYAKGFFGIGQLKISLGNQHVEWAKAVPIWLLGLSTTPSAPTVTPYQLLTSPAAGWLDSCSSWLWNQFCRNRAWTAPRKAVHNSDFDFSYLRLRTSAPRVTVRDISLEQKSRRSCFRFFSACWLS